MTRYTDDRFNGRPTTTMWVVGQDGEKLEFESPFVSLEEVMDVLLSSSNPFAKGMGLSMKGRPMSPNDAKAAWAHHLALSAIQPKGVKDNS